MKTLIKNGRVVTAVDDYRQATRYGGGCCAGHVADDASALGDFAL